MAHEWPSLRASTLLEVILRNTFLFPFLSEGLESPINTYSSSSSNIGWKCTSIAIDVFDSPGMYYSILHTNDHVHPRGKTIIVVTLVSTKFVVGFGSSFPLQCLHYVAQCPSFLHIMQFSFFLNLGFWDLFIALRLDLWLQDYCCFYYFIIIIIIFCLVLY